MTKKIFVGNLSFQTSETDLSDLFGQVGTVESVSIITDRMTGRSKGFGFVEMESEQAEQAIARFNGAEVSGRKLPSTKHVRWSSVTTTVLVDAIAIKRT